MFPCYWVVKQEHNIFVLYSGHNLNILCLFFSCFFLTQRASRGARRQLNPAESRRDGEKRSQFLWNRGCLILGTMWMWHCVCVDTASQCRRTSNLYVVWRKLGCPTVLTDACMSYDWPRHLSMTQCWEYRSVIYVRFACRLVRSTKVGSR